VIRAVRQSRRERMLNMTTLQKATVGAALAAALGTGIFEVRQNSKLNKQIQTLQQEQQSLTERIRGLEEEHDKTKQQVAALRNRTQPAVQFDAAVGPSPKVANGAALPSVGLEHLIISASPSCRRTFLALWHIWPQDQE
jgi:cell division protein FtsB